jgi:hypothetical protein
MRSLYPVLVLQPMSKKKNSPYQIHRTVTEQKAF